MPGASRYARLVLAALAVAAATWPALDASSARGAEQLSSAAPRNTADTRHLTLTTSVTPAAASAGPRIVLNVDVALKPKMHVYAPDQPKDQDYMPIVLTVAPADAYRLEKPRFPVSEKFFFAPLKETQHVYSKPFRITQPIMLTRAIGAEPLTISGSVRYQACDDAICYVPQTVPVTWIVPTTAAPTKSFAGDKEFGRPGDSF
jgi:DsbC/DsbD-like thiol-disulfide interchange protein